jgi:hypothetical protein
MPGCTCYPRVGPLPDPDLCCSCAGARRPGQPGISAGSRLVQRPPRSARRTAGTRPAAKDAPVLAGWRFPAATRHTGGPSAPARANPFGASPYAPGTAPNHHSAPARRPTADRITHSNEKRLLGISKSRILPADSALLLVAGSALDDWCRIAGSAQRGGIRQPGRPAAPITRSRTDASNAAPGRWRRRR